jgi:hypothetical protein
MCFILTCRSFVDAGCQLLVYLMCGGPDLQIVVFCFFSGFLFWWLVTRCFDILLFSLEDEEGGMEGGKE